MTPWKKRYHSIYQDLKDEFDSKAIEWINSKENIICASPLSNDQLKHGLTGFRRYKSGKLRILYALSTEKLELWGNESEENEVMFVYVDLRKDETYKAALKLLRRHDVL